jgi:hypothetical protein
VKILLDENLPRKLVAALRAEGHHVESVHTLRMQGLDNGALYRFASGNFDLCFTRDAGFAHNMAPRYFQWNTQARKSVIKKSELRSRTVLFWIRLALSRCGEYLLAKISHFYGRFFQRPMCARIGAFFGR